MLKTLPIVFMVLAANLSCARQDSTATIKDFRNTHWGMTAEEVKAVETAKPITSELGTVCYAARFDSHDVIVRYIFNTKALYFGGYYYQTKYADDTVYLDDFYKKSAELEKKYGPPQTGFDWKNSEYLADTTQYGKLAYDIRRGYLGIGNSWETDRSEISLGLCGENNEITMTLFYYDRATFYKTSQVPEGNQKSQKTEMSTKKTGVAMEQGE